MSNGAECCALLICCPPEQQRAALVKIFCLDGCDEHAAGLAADAPRSFAPVVVEIAKRARATKGKVKVPELLAPIVEEIAVMARAHPAA